MKDGKQIKWEIKFDEAQGLWTAINENGICVYADGYEKLQAWLKKKNKRFYDMKNLRFFDFSIFDCILPMVHFVISMPQCLNFQMQS